MKIINKKLILLGVLVISCTCGLIGQNLSVFVSPHPDDWQLFMNPNAYNELKKPNNKVIFIHTTSGDGGNPDTSYYKGREEGSLRAIRFMVGTIYGSSGKDMNPQKIIINGHLIQRYSLFNAIVYFLRLPDGGNGGGYSIHNYQNIQKLYDGSISQISTIDSSTDYSSLNDLENTIKDIISLESNNSSSIQLNLADTDLDLNPNDHLDHIYSSLIIQKIVKRITPVFINFYRDYTTANSPQNVFNDDFLIDAATWGATCSGLSDNNLNTTWDIYHNAWIGKQYYRTVYITDSISDQTNDTIPPSTPTNFVANSVSSNSVNLSWGASTDNIGVAGYKLFRNGLLIGTTTLLGYADNSLSPETNYSYTINSYDAQGNQSSFSNPISITTNSISPQPIDSIPPSVPTNLSYTMNNSSIVLNWNASTDNVRVTSYDIFNGSNYMGSTTTNSIIFTNLICNTTYAFSIKAKDASNNISSNSSNLIINMTNCGTQTPYSGNPILIPGKIECENFDNGGQSVAYYDTDIYISGGQFRSTEDVDIEPCSEGGYNIGWINNGEWLEYTAKVDKTATYDLEIRYAGNSAGTMEISFNNGNISTGDISLSPTGGWQVWQTRTIKGITLNAGEQIMRINMKTGGFNLNYINVKSIILDLVAPTEPIGLTASNIGQTSLNLSWTASTDNVGVSSYNIYRNGILFSSSSTTIYTDNNVVPATNYSYMVSALDAAGNESLKSQQINATTLAPSANLALNKPTTSSSFEGNKFSSLAVDGINSLSSWWGANPYPQWWQVDLQNEYLINKVVVVNYYDGSRFYRYDIKVSTDGVNWSTLVDFNNNTSPATSVGNTFNVNSVNARYIRVNMNYNSSNVGVHIIEFEAYGTLNHGTTIAATSQRLALESINTAIDSPESMNLENTGNYLLYIFPNPLVNGSEINLIYNVPTSGEKIKVDILSLTGKRMSSKEFISVAGRNSIKISPAKPLLGTYLVVSEVKGKREVKKIFIE